MSPNFITGYVIHYKVIYIIYTRERKSRQGHGWSHHTTRSKLSATSQGQRLWPRGQGHGPPNVIMINYSAYIISVASPTRKETRAVARKLHDAAAVLFGLKFADSIHYKFKNSQASNARLQSSKHTGAKQNLTQNGHSRSFKVTCFGISGKAIYLR